MGFELQFTGKEITAWGGMGLMKRMLDRIGPVPLFSHTVWLGLWRHGLMPSQTNHTS